MLLEKNSPSKFALSFGLFNIFPSPFFNSETPLLIFLFEYTYTAVNFQGFNVLLESVCKSNNCHFVDWFSEFLNYTRKDIETSLYSDSLHLNRAGYHVLNSLLEELLKNHFTM